jgi:L-lactate dehydrogenase (cytochrome)
LLANTPNVMKTSYKNDYPSIYDLMKKAKSKIPNFAFEYLEGGCNEDVNLVKNTKEIRDIELKPFYFRECPEVNLKAELFGQTYDAPFGISPIGLQGLIWPNAPEILAKASLKHNIPFILSTVSTSTIERIGEITEGRSWFQLYHPKEKGLCDKIIKRVEDAGYPVLVILSDAPTFGYRPRDIRNGIGLPPKMSFRNIFQIMGRPEWAFKTLYYGIPTFANMEPYIRKGMKMEFCGRLSEQKVAEIRDKWKGRLVIKGVASEEDTELAIKLGLDGIIVSNHGGRQLDVGQSSIKMLNPIVKKYQGKIKIMLDSGLRSGPDIARTLASGAEFTFLGRSFMYAVAALGNEGGDYAIESLKIQLKQVMDQISCSSVVDLKNHLVASGC